MKKSALVPTTFLAAFAASFIAGGCNQRQRCEDSFGKIRPDEDCRRGVTGTRFVPIGGFGSSGGGTGGSSSSFGG